MASRAGIALGRLAYDAQFAITRVDGYPGPAIFCSPTTHTLSEAHTIKDMIEAFELVIDFDLTHDENGYAIAYPIASNFDQCKGVQNAKLYSHDHFHAWANEVGHSVCNDGESKQDVYLLFVDLTPGQVASKVHYGNMYSWGWRYNWPGTKAIVLSEEEQQGTESWTSQDVFDKLVKSILPPHDKKLELVGILRPQGSFPNLSAFELGSMFNSVPIKWIQLTDISYGTAMLMHSQALSYDLGKVPGGPAKARLPAGITLANGKTITIVSACTYCPVERKLFFTNSQDNQTTATVKIVRGITPFQKLTLEGLTPKPRGEARIKVIFEIGRHGYTSLKIEEGGTDKKVYQSFESILYCDRLEMDAYEKQTTGKQIDMTIGADGIVGELPA
ncbi:hypothetical protein CPB86DRAFT_197224 [Serendipita vermifera]|nr:hypothetical protein CPB86DRAFT_197224 [Serendipita vermifera]